MPDSFRISPLQPGPGLLGPAAAPPAGGTVADDFAAALRDQLQQVAKVQNEADEQVRLLASGETSSMTEVMTATRKAQVAFSLLMEIRNKLVDAYQELQNMRV